MKLHLNLIAVVVLLLPNAALAQNKGGAPSGYLDFTPVRLTLGMPKDRTIASLSEHYDVSPWKGGDIEDSWAVSQKTGPHLVKGSLSFVNGVLIRAASFWDIEDSAYALSHTLSLLLDHLRDEGFTHCTISTRKSPTPDVETEVLGIDCGQKGIVVQADKYRGKDDQVITVMENLEARFTPR